MKKKEFLDIFAGYDRNRMSKIYEDIELSKKIGCPIATEEFLTPDIYLRLGKMKAALGVDIAGYGVFNECERKMICFGNSIDEHVVYDIDLIKVTNKSKFKSLSHRDYMGSLMSLGIRRELFGDLAVKDDCCFIPSSSKISTYIVNNLQMVGHCPCSVEVVDIDCGDVPQIVLEEKVIISTSMRIDSIIPGLCGLSRNRGIDLISSGSVMINYLECRKKDEIVESGDTVTIRGYGKFKVISVAGETAKGRNKVIIGKYI